MKYRSPDSRIVGLVDAATATTIIIFYRRLSHLSLSLLRFPLTPARRPIPLRMPIKNLPFGDFTREREREKACFRGSWDRPARKASLSSPMVRAGERKGACLYPGSDGPLCSLPAPDLPKLEIPCRLIPSKFHRAAPQRRGNCAGWFIPERAAARCERRRRRRIFRTRHPYRGRKCARIRHVAPCSLRLIGVCIVNA